MGSKVTNQLVSRIFLEIADYLRMEAVPFKPQAFEKAADSIGSLTEEVKDVYARGGLKALREIPGIGASISEKIEELIKTGRIKDYEKLKKRTPVDLSALRAVQGLGPKSIQTLYEELGIKDVASLEKAAKAGKIGTLAGFGKKSEENILKGIEFVKKSGGRFVLGFIVPRVRRIEEDLRQQKGVDRVIVAGSTRRKKETIGDVDILVISKKPKEVMDYFVHMPSVTRILAEGDTRSSVETSIGLNIDLRVVPPESYGAALNYFTGSKEHNVALRQIAMDQGYKLNEYGLWKNMRGKEIAVAGETEEGIYKTLGLRYIEPELRENTGEIQAAKGNTLPNLIGYDDLLGDLQVQTNWTDGKESIETMAKMAMARGLKYIAITDHTKNLAMTGGLDDKRILKQMAEIDEVNKKMGGTITVLKGTECDILKDGSLDLGDEVLSKLDVVGASVHTYFNLARKDQTERIKRAMQNPHADILFHPTGRIIEKRPAYEVDMDELVAEAKRTGMAMEIDAYPDRTDLKDEHIRKCVEVGVKLSIDSDAHRADHFAFLEYGIAQARRGWAEKKDIVNAWPVSKLKEMLK